MWSWVEVEMTWVEVCGAVEVFFCEFCEISKATFFTEDLWMTASENSIITS